MQRETVIGEATFRDDVVIEEPFTIPVDPQRGAAARYGSSRLNFNRLLFAVLGLSLGLILYPTLMRMGR